MQGRSQTWQSLVNAGNYTVIPHLTISENFIYGTETIVDMKSSIKVLGSGDNYDIPNVGNCISAQLDLTLKGSTDFIPRMAKLEPYIDLTNGTLTTTDHLKKGVFFIDTRKVNSAGSTIYDYDTIAITAYDSMMLTELSYYTLAGDQGTWPKTDITVVSEIASRIGVQLDSSVSSIMNKGYDVQYPGYGESGLTLRETLGTIGAMYAGNWIISDDGKLKLIQIKEKSSSDQTITKYSNIDISDPNAAFTRVIINIDSDTYYTYPGTNLSYSTWQSNTSYSVGTPVVYNSNYYICSVSHTSGSTFDSSKWNKDIIFALDCQWGTAAMAQDIYNIVGGYSYRGFKLEEAIFDPALEIGDRITVGSANVYVFNRDLIFDYLMIADLEAPIESEIDHEFQYQLGSGSAIQRNLAAVKTSLTVQSGQIEGLIEGQITTYRSPTNPYDRVGVTRHTGDLWYCTADITSGGVSYTANTWYRYNGTSWEETTANVDVAPDWESSHSYAVNDVITYNGHWYKCRTAHTSGSSWDSSKWTVCDTISDVSRSQINQVVDAIELSVSNGSSTGSMIKLTANGIEHKADNIFLSADLTRVTGKLVWASLDSGVQTTINTAATTASSAASTASSAASTASSAYSLAEDAKDQISAWSYGSTTYIDGTQIYTGTVTASTIRGGTIQLLNSSGNAAGSMSLASASSGTYAVEMFSNAALRFRSLAGDLFLGAKTSGASTNTAYVHIVDDGYVQIAPCIVCQNYGTANPSSSTPGYGYNGALYFKYS